MSDMQYIYYGAGVLSILFTIVMTSRHTEQRFEKRMTRNETLLMLCCKKLKVPIDDINR